MSFLNRLIDTEKTSQMTVKDPRELYGEVLKRVSGSGQVRDVKCDIFYQIVAFKGITEGVGCSTLVANTAIAIADIGLTVCVVDTSVMSPVQDTLLKTEYKDTVPDKDKRLDWYDMPYTKLSVLHESKLRKNISVLSFYGKDRGVIDVLSVNDSSELVDLAFTTLHNKFDIILVDCCHELTSINTAALQQSQHIIQVWNDSPTVLKNIDNFINNCAILSCPLDKMKNVVYSRVIDDVIGNMDVILNQYKLIKLAQTKFSKDVQRVLVIGKPVYQYASTDEDIINYTEAIIAIACHVCNIRDEDAEPKGTITSNDIMDGKVEGTYHKELKDFNDSYAKNHPVEIATTLEQADAQLAGKTISAKDFEPDAEPVKVSNANVYQGEEQSSETPKPAEQKRGFGRKKKEGK